MLEADRYGTCIKPLNGGLKSKRGTVSESVGVVSGDCVVRTLVLTAAVTDRRSTPSTTS